MTTQSITSGQEKQFKRFVEDAAEKALREVGLGKDELQKLIENGNEFQAYIIAGIRRFSAVDKQFTKKDEEVKSDYVYPKEYKGPKPIEDQIKALAKIFDLDPSQALEFAKNLPELPKGAEEWFAILRWKRVAKTYGEAVEKALKQIKQQHKGDFCNWREGKLGELYLRQHKGTIKKLQVLADQQKDCDILVIPAQFGRRHNGRAVRWVREIFMANEFGFGAFAIGCMLLTHPERLVSYHDLWIDCPGDEYAPDADGNFSDAPYFSFSVENVRLGTLYIGGEGTHYGSVTGFLPQ